MTDVPRLSGQARLAGRRLRNRYRLETLIGSGGMAHVWEATDEILERRVAIKILHDHLQADEAFVARFRAEGVAAARLAHRSIVSIFDQISEPDIEAIVMELIECETMRDWLDQRPIPPIEDTVAVLSSVADALGAAHQVGLVHRDIKPANILLAADGRVIVADFGIAKLATDPNLTATGALMGTARYLSPEQVRGEELDGRSDLYSLAVMLYEAICGRVPYDANNDMATALARLQRPPAAPRSINNAIAPAIEAVALRGLALDRNDRFPDAAAFRVALQGALRAMVNDRPKLLLATPPAPAIDEAATFAESERSWLLPTLVLLLVVVGLGVAGLLLSATDTGRDILDSAKSVVGADAGPPDRGTTNGTGDDPGTTDDGAVLPIVDATSFDPQGSGNPPNEREDLVGNLFDGNVDSVWQTEGYDTRSFGNLKTGVGVIIELDDVARISTVEIVSTNTGWAAELYGTDQPIDNLGTLEQWGSPVAAATNIAGDVAFDDLALEADTILVWITDLGDEPPRVRVRLGEIVVLGSP